MKRGIWLFVACGGLAAITASPGARAQQPAPSPQPLNQAQINAAWSEAVALGAQGRQAAAADRYMQIVAGTAPSLQSARAALRAGHAYSAADQLEKALASYDAVIALPQTLYLKKPRDKVILKDMAFSAAGNKAAVLEKQGKLEEAAEAYGSLVRPLLGRHGPLGNITFDRAMQGIENAHSAAKCLERAGKYGDAIYYYDAIIAIGEAKGYEEDTLNRKIAYQIQNNMAGALYDKARACVQAGQLQQAQDAISRMRAEFVDCPAAVEILALEAQIQGRNTGSAQWLVLQETRASDQLKSSGLTDPLVPASSALDSLDQVISSYPQTSAALRAMEEKGELLKEQGQFQQAEDTLTQLMKQLGEPAFRSRLYQTAWIQFVESRFKRLQRATQDHQPVSDQDWDELRTILVDIQQRAIRPLDRATAHFLVIETCGLQKRTEEMLQECNRFIEMYGKEKLPGHLFWAHYFAARCLQKKHQYGEAFKHWDWIVDFHDNKGGVPPKNWFMSLTFYRRWETLRDSGAPAAAVNQAAFELLRRYPNSTHAQSLTASTSQ